MMSFKGEQPVPRIQPQMSAFVGSATAPDVLSEATDEGAVVSNDFGFADAAIGVESRAEPEYRVTHAVTGFAPSTTYYIGEIAESAFPNVQSFAYMVGKRAFDIAFAAMAIAVTSPL